MRTLKRRGESFRWKRDSWDVVLRLAQQFGWQPAGTFPPRGVRKADWDSGDYRSCERQQVTAEDALGLAAAIAKALKLIPDKYFTKPPKTASAELQFFFPQGREGLSNFVAFCQRGAFRVTDDVCNHY